MELMKMNRHTQDYNPSFGGYFPMNISFQLCVQEKQESEIYNSKM